MGTLGLSDLAGAGTPQGLDGVVATPVRRYRRLFRLLRPVVREPAPSPDAVPAGVSADVFVSLRGSPTALTHDQERTDDPLPVRRLRADLAAALSATAAQGGDVSLAITSTLRGPHSVLAPRIAYRST